MSATVQPLFPVNQTHSFIETSTDRNNFTNGNYSGDVTNVKSNNASFLELFENLNTHQHIFWGFVLFIAVTGIIGNILVFLMMGDQKLRSLSYSVYLKCLAVSDSCLLINIVIYETEKIYFLGQLPELKIMLGFVLFSLRVLSPWLVVGLTVDRYVCVCFPLTRERFCTRMKATIVCSILLGLSVLLILPFPFHSKLIRGQYFPTEEVREYFIFIRSFSSILPCLFILALNILIIIQIKRSLNFRRTFIRSTIMLANRQQDSSTRPLVLVSLLAFVTMIPVSVQEVVIISITLSNIDVKYVGVNRAILAVVFLIYLLNFGQNFYILIGSSSNYRQIIKTRLRCFSVKLNKGNRANQTMVTDIPCNNSGSECGTTGLSLVSIVPGDMQ